jgi:flagellar biosynthetic protein FlhB
MISYFVILNFLPDLVHITNVNLFSAVNKISEFYPIIAIALLVVLAFIGIIDVIWQKYDFIKSLRMSHQDVKDEYKETDGQPEVKQKIRKLQAQAAMKARKESSSIDDIGEATAIITNPTHFAVALKYEVGEASAPKVICKGKGKNAELIIKKGRELEIGTMQSPKLARAIYFTCEIGEEIMSQLYSAVAIALAYIYKVNNGEEIDKPDIDIPNELVFDEFGRKDAE